MAVFRVEKNRDYTVMSNHHLRNKALSLKAKGLLSQMLSLPEDWDYTLKGLSLINRESIDAIRTAVSRKICPRPTAPTRHILWWRSHRTLTHWLPPRTMTGSLPCCPISPCALPA